MRKQLLAIHYALIVNVIYTMNRWISHSELRLSVTLMIFFSCTLLTAQSKQWRQLSTPMDSRQKQAVNVLLTHESELFGISNNQPVYSNDAAKSWTDWGPLKLKNNPDSYKKFEYDRFTDSYILLCDSAIYVHASDHGSWTMPLPTFLEGHVIDFTRLNGQDFVVTSDGLYRSDGNNFKRVETTVKNYRRLKAVGSILFAWIAEVGLSKSLDSGRTWSIVSLGNDPILSDPFYANSTFLYSRVEARETDSSRYIMIRSDLKTGRTTRLKLPVIVVDTVQFRCIFDGLLSLNGYLFLRQRVLAKEHESIVNSYLFRSLDNGDSWDTLTIPLSNDLFFSAFGSLYQTDTSTYQQSTDSGVSWQIESPSTEALTFSSLSDFYSDSRAADALLAAFNNSCLFLTHYINRKSDWRNIRLPHTGSRLLSFAEPLSIEGLYHQYLLLFAFDDGDLYLQYSSHLEDFSTPWTVIKTKKAMHSLYSHLLKDSKTLILAASGSSVLRSLDTAKSWQTFSFPDPEVIANAFEEYDGVYYAGTSNGIYRSTDAGQTWMLEDTPMMSVYSLKVVQRVPLSELVLYASSSSGLYRRSANDSLWTLVAFANQSVRKLQVYYWTTKVYYYVLATNLVDSLGRVYSATNPDSAWSLLDAGLPATASVSDLHTYKSYTYASVEGHGVYQYNSFVSDTVSFADEIGLDSNIMSLGPIPTDKNVHIRLRPECRVVSITIQSILGNIVRELQCNDADLDFYVSVDDLAAGAYELTANSNYGLLKKVFTIVR